MNISSKFKLKQTFISRSMEETESFGASIGKTLVKGQVLGLIGNLGAGKTCLTRGVYKGKNQHAKVMVNSPTFVVMQRYEGELTFYHADIYRLENKQEFIDLDLFEMAEDGVLIVEWADKFLEVFDDKTILIELIHQSEKERTINLFQN